MVNDTTTSLDRHPRPLALVVEFLLATRADDERIAAEARDELAALGPDELATGLPDDQTKLSFWIDIYNAAVVRQRNIDLSSWPKRLRFLRRTVLTVAGQPLSLDAIEHGILRRSRWRLTGGYLANPRPSRYERQQRVERLDPRIHFALNCAAASCPPIAAYRVPGIDAQLDVATKAYLAASVSVAHDRIVVPRIFLWYRGDFGGGSGVRTFLRRFGVADRDLPIRFAPYDWTPTPGRWFADSDPDER